MQMYKIIELRDFDVLLPFVCRKCGSCCHGFAPQIIAEDLPRIGQHIGKPSEEIMKLHKEAYRKKFTDSPINCSFLNNKNQCSIYSMRPEPCQLYPLETDFGTADVNCVGYREFHGIVDAFFARRKYAALWSPNTYKKDIRRIPKLQWRAVRSTINRSQPSKAMIQLIMKLNKIQNTLRGKTD